MKYVIILGAGKSGKSVCNKLAEKGLLPVLFDDQYIKGENQKKWVEHCEFMVISPSVKEDNIVVGYAKELGKKVIGEIEFSFECITMPYKNIVGVTGTNGKTTTVTMLGNSLKGDAVVAGNIGLPWATVLDDGKENCILELSSFQLMTTHLFKPNIACILNLAPDHIDFHGSLENYYSSKLKLIQNLTDKDFLVLNSEDKVLCDLTSGCIATKFYFGFDNQKDGCFVENNIIYFRRGNDIEFIADINAFGQMLRHNLLNLMASITILILMDKNIYAVLHEIQNYEYEPYRMKYCGKINDVSIYNDSKATNVAACVTGLKALSTYKSMALILGGIYKNESFQNVFNCENVKVFYLFGKSKEILMKEAECLGKKNVQTYNSLHDIVDEIFSKTLEFDCVYFAPGCASFDMFSGYEERGKVFDFLIDKYRN